MYWSRSCGPGTGDPVPDGEVGEVVVTSFDPHHPWIRLALGDLSAILPGASPCGRTNTRIRGWMGRADQTTKVKGMFVRPEQIAEIGRRHPRRRAPATRGRAQRRVRRNDAEGRDATNRDAALADRDPAIRCGRSPSSAASVELVAPGMPCPTTARSSRTRARPERPPRQRKTAPEGAVCQAQTVHQRRRARRRPSWRLAFLAGCESTSCVLPRGTWCASRGAPSRPGPRRTRLARLGVGRRHGMPVAMSIAAIIASRTVFAIALIASRHRRQPAWRSGSLTVVAGGAAASSLMPQSFSSSAWVGIVPCARRVAGGPRLNRARSFRRHRAAVDSGPRT